MYFKQSKPITVKILGVSILLLAAYITYASAPSLSQILSMSSIGIFLLGYSIVYEIKADFNNMTHYRLFGYTVFRQPLNLDFPDYITVFSAKFTRSTDWGPVAAMGKGGNNSASVIRLFKGNKYFTVLKTSSLALANTEAERLGNLLNVEVKRKY